MKIPELKEEIEIPNQVTVEKKNGIVAVKGLKGTAEKKITSSLIEIKVENGKVIVKAINSGKKKKRVLYSFVSHIKNMIDGVMHGVTYKLKICSGHFPMNVSVTGDMFIVKNFLGEKVPRTLKLRPGIKVKVDGQIVNVEGSDLELVSQTAADIETLTRRRGFDFNRFQDGIYIIDKGEENA